MSARFVKRRQDDRPTREMQKDELLGLLTEGEREVIRRRRAGTTVQPLQSSLAPIAPVDDLAIPVQVEHSPLPIAPAPLAEGTLDSTAPIADDAFTIDTRELDARVFRKHALNPNRSGSIRAIGSAPAVPLLPAEPAAPPVSTAAHRATTATGADAEATELVAPLALDVPDDALALAPSRARIFVWTALVSVVLTGGTLLALHFLK